MKISFSCALTWTLIVQNHSDQGRTSHSWGIILSLKVQDLSLSAIADPSIPPSSQPATDPQSPHLFTNATVTSPLWLQHSSIFQPIGSVDPSLIYIQVKDSTDRVKDPVAMVTELRQDSLVIQFAGDQTTRGSHGKRKTMMGPTLEIIKPYCFFNESISFNMFSLSITCSRE